MASGQRPIRNGNIDALRLIAALGVIALHVGPYPELPSLLAEVIRGSFRWCVPFFFLLTGYYLADLPRATPLLTPERLAVPLRAFVVASLVFLPVLWINSGVGGISLSTLLRGSYGHLWYLTALIIGLITLYSFREESARLWLWAAAVVILLAYVALNHFYALTGRHYGAVMALRELSAIPALLFGGGMRVAVTRGRAGPRVFVLLLAVGVVVTIAESLGLHLAGGQPAKAQFFAGTLPLAAGLLGLAMTTGTLAPDWFAAFGRRESLGIYLYHPAAVLVVTSLWTGEIRTAPEGAPGLLLWGGAAVIIMASLEALRRYTPGLRRLLDGEIAPPAFVPAVPGEVTSPETVTNLPVRY